MKRQREIKMQIIWNELTRNENRTDVFATHTKKKKKFNFKLKVHLVRYFLSHIILGISWWWWCTLRVMKRQSERVQIWFLIHQRDAGRVKQRTVFCEVSMPGFELSVVIGHGALRSCVIQWQENYNNFIFMMWDQFMNCYGLVRGRLCAVGVTHKQQRSYLAKQIKNVSQVVTC